MRGLLLVLLFPFFLLSQTSFELAQNYYLQGNSTKATPLFEKHLNQYPADLATLEYLGDIAGEAQQWDSAMMYYKALVDNDISNANYHYKYGGVLGMKALSVNKFSAAFYISDVKTHFKKAATLDPTHIKVREALVELYMQLPAIIGGSEATALFYADELAQLSEEKGYLAKGYIADYTGDVKAAEQLYKKAIAQQGSLESIAKLIGFYKNTNQINKALEVLKQNLTLDGQQNELNYQIGALAASYNLEPELAITYLKTYLENYSTNDNTSEQWAYLRLAQVYKNTGDKSKALFWIDKALNLAPEFKEAAKEKKLIQLL